jgi:hypothetical protein
MRVEIALVLITSGSVFAAKIPDNFFYDTNNTSTNFTISQQSNEDRKVSAASLFSGIAQSCNHLSNVVSAENQQQQQAAACNLVGSVFNIAALLSAKEKPNQQTTVQSTPEKNNFIGKITSLTCDLLDILRNNAMRPLFMPESSILFQIDQLKTREDKQKVIKECLMSKDLVQPFLQELFNVLSKFISSQLSKTLETITRQLPEQLKLIQEPQ